MRQNNVWLRRTGEGGKKLIKGNWQLWRVGMLRKDAQTVLLRVENFLVLVGAEKL